MHNMSGMDSIIVFDCRCLKGSECRRVRVNSAEQLLGEEVMSVDTSAKVSAGWMIWCVYWMSR